MRRSLFYNQIPCLFSQVTFWCSGDLSNMAGLKYLTTLLQPFVRAAESTLYRSHPSSLSILNPIHSFFPHLFFLCLNHLPCPSPFLSLVLMLKTNAVKCPTCVISRRHFSWQNMVKYTLGHLWAYKESMHISCVSSGCIRAFKGMFQAANSAVKCPLWALMLGKTQCNVLWFSLTPYKMWYSAWVFL